MTAYESFIRRGRWLIARRRLLPPMFIASCVGALLLATPFRIEDRWWLTAVSVALACVAMWIKALAGAAALDHRRRGMEGVATMPELIAAGGVYSVTRFPGYAADVLSVAALALFTGVGWFIPLAALTALLVAAVMVLAHEQAMQTRYGAQFEQWCTTTRTLRLPLRPSRSGIKAGPVALLLQQGRAIAQVIAGFCIMAWVKGLRIDFDPVPGVGWIIALAVAVSLAWIAPRR